MSVTVACSVGLAIAPTLHRAETHASSYVIPIGRWRALAKPGGPVGIKGNDVMNKYLLKVKEQRLSGRRRDKPGLS